MKTRLFIVTLDGRISYLGGTRRTVLPKVKEVILEYLDEAAWCVRLNFGPSYMFSYTTKERNDMQSIAHINTWQIREIINEVKDISDFEKLVILGPRMSIKEHYLR